MTKNTKSSRGATPRPLRQFDLAHTLGSINSLHKQQFKWRHGGESPPPLPDRLMRRTVAPLREEAPIEKADAATLEKDADAAAAARAAAAVRAAAAAWPSRHAPQARLKASVAHSRLAPRAAAPSAAASRSARRLRSRATRDAAC